MRVLIAEDDSVTRHQLEALLAKWGYEPVVCRDGEEAWRLLQGNDPPPLAIIDWIMPGIDGVRLCKQVRERGQEPYTYILLLTVKDRKEDVIEGLEAGADDYITKPFNAHELRVRLGCGKRVVELQRALIAAREELRAQATHDWLTGLWNRMAVLDVLNHELRRARRKGTSVAVIMADLDNLKPVNDTYGHLAGDAVLREVANRLRASVRGYDAVGRFGGDEFLVVLSECNTRMGLQLAYRMHESLCTPMGVPGAEVSVSASFGVAATEGKPIVSADALIKAADEALYRAKSKRHLPVRIEAADVVDEGI